MSESHPDMPAASKTHTQAQSAEYRYHLLRAASERFQRNVAALEPEQRAEAERQARQTLELESLVLASTEARDVMIPDAQVQDSLKEVASRYDDAEEFRADLARNGLDTAGMTVALRRELTFDAVMQRIAAGHVPIAETDERLFYELHRDRFTAPEQRTARHILITINDDYSENTRSATRARLEAIADKLRTDSGSGDMIQRFARQARRNSECPTALEDG